MDRCNANVCFRSDADIRDKVGLTQVKAIRRMISFLKSSPENK